MLSNMKHSSSLLILLLLSIPFLGCHKADDDSDDRSTPVLTITSPAVSAAITGNVTIAGVATDNSLHEMEMKITRDSDGSTLWEKSPTVHDLTSYTIAETWSPSGLTGITPVTLTVKTDDHNSNSVTQTVRFVVNP